MANPRRFIGAGFSSSLFFLDIQFINTQFIDVHVHQRSHQTAL
jgi:hypothetical protein